MDDDTTEEYLNDSANEISIPEYKMEGSLIFIRESKCGCWLLIKQPTSREEKWVDKKLINIFGSLIAFYDADATLLPKSERKKV